MSAQPDNDYTQGGLRTIGEILATPPTYPIPVVERDGPHLVIYEVQESGEKWEVYDIPVAGVQDAKGVAFWMRQMAQKQWITTKHLYLLAVAIHALHEAG
jgi:hypothetical protein